MNDKTPRQEPVTDESSDVFYLSEIEKLQQKLKRAYIRRDHYAQQYYRTVSELDETKFQLSLAKKKIQQLTAALVLQNPSLPVMKMEQHSHQPESNGHESPELGTAAMSPGLERSEGHPHLDDSVDDDLRVTPPPSDVGMSPARSRLNSGGSGHSAAEKPNDKPQLPPKRVAFCDIPVAPHSTSSQYDHVPHNQPVFQRSYTMAGSEMQSAFIPPQPTRIQRTQTVGYERRMPPSHQYPPGPGFRGPQFAHNPSSHPPVHHHPSQPPPPPPRHVNGPFSLTADHGRLPRVHRGVVGYENVIPQHTHPSAMMSRMSGMAPPHIQTMMAEMPISNNVRASFRLYSAFNARQQQSQRTSHMNGVNRGLPSSMSESQRWFMYDGLTDRDIHDLVSQLADVNCSVKRLEISRSNLGNSSLMERFCKELRKNRSIEHLSLPINGIGRDALKVLLDTVTCCKNIRELLLCNNAIGVECFDVIMHFLHTSMVESIVLSGNEIEQHSYMFAEALPKTSVHDDPAAMRWGTHAAMKQSHTQSTAHYSNDH